MELTPEKRLNLPPAAPQIPSELSRFLKSDDWQKKLVPGSLGGVGVAVTVSDDWFGSVGVCLYMLIPLVSMFLLVLALDCKKGELSMTYATAPYPAARRVKKVVKRIFVVVNLPYRSGRRELDDTVIM